MAGPREGPGVKAKGGPGKSRRWTVMIMGRLGKMRTFKISPHVVYWALLFLVLYLPVSVLVFNRWVDLRRTAREQATRIDQVSLELARAERALFKFKQHVTLLELYIESLEEQGTKPATVETPSQETAEEETPPAQRVSAARVIFSETPKLREAFDLAERVTALEGRAEEK